ncbi:MAG: MerR family transcriptional regulator [Candidatus Omnitrophota bacterium]|nr:MAG: MerR family transcriptional regulator [Candidatus Omnitrophota bacterium]
MRKKIHKHILNIEDFDIDIPLDEPIYTLSVICRLLHMEYYRLHEILKEGIVKPKRVGKRKKMFSHKDIKRIKYIQYLMEEEGVNIQGIRVILEMAEEE